MCKELLREPWLTALYLPLSHSSPLLVAALDSYFHTLSLVAGFPSCVLFIFQGFIRTWSFSSFFFPSQFQAIFFFFQFYVSKSSAAFRPESWAMMVGSTSFQTQVPHASKCMHLLDESVVWRRIPESGPSHYCAGSPWLSTHPSFQETEMFCFVVKRNCAQTLCQGCQKLLLPTEKPASYSPQCKFSNRMMSYT